MKRRIESCCCCCGGGGRGGGLTAVIDGYLPDVVVQPVQQAPDAQHQLLQPPLQGQQQHHHSPSGAATFRLG